MNAENRFWSKVEKTNHCWNWKGRKDNGYGRFDISGKQHKAHRISYSLLKGILIPLLEIDHLCRNRACVNPVHLEQVSKSVNQRRGFGAGGINSRKTNCPQGHLLYGDNLYIEASTSHRRCLICKRKQNRLWKRKKEMLIRG